MQIDTIKAVAVFTLAGLIIVLGFFTLRDPGVGSDVKILFGGFVGAAIQFVFGDASNTRGQRSFQAGLYTPSPPSPSNVQAVNPPVAADPPGGAQ